MIRTMIRAAMLRADAYEEVEANKSATGQAMAIVVLVSLATGIGYTSLTGATSWSLIDMVQGAVVSLIAWALLAWITFIVGAKLLPSAETKANWGGTSEDLGVRSNSGYSKDRWPHSRDWTIFVHIWVFNGIDGYIYSD